MKNRYLKIFSLAAGMFFLNNAEGMEAERFSSNTLKNVEQEIRLWAGYEPQMEKPEPVYENSPLVRNYKSEYEEKFRDLIKNDRTARISGLLIRTYYRLLETTTLDQQRPLFAKWEALALMLIQTEIPRVQTIRQLLDSESYVRIAGQYPIRPVLGDDLNKFKRTVLENGRNICKTLVSLQDLFMNRSDINADSITINYNRLLTQLREWMNENQRYEKNCSSAHGFGMVRNFLNCHINIYDQPTLGYGRRVYNEICSEDDRAIKFNVYTGSTIEPR